MTDHIKNSVCYVITHISRTEHAFQISNWHEAGLTLAENEDLYLIRMCITIDAKNSVASFNEHDRQRLEQIIIDSLGTAILFLAKNLSSF